MAEMLTTAISVGCEIIKHVHKTCQGGLGLIKQEVWFGEPFENKYDCGKIGILFIFLSFFSMK